MDHLCTYIDQLRTPENEYKTLLTSTMPTHGGRTPPSICLGYSTPTVARSQNMDSRHGGRRQRSWGEQTRHRGWRRWVKLFLDQGRVKGRRMRVRWGEGSGRRRKNGEGWGGRRRPTREEGRERDWTIFLKKIN